MRCIFCKANSSDSRSIEHIIPESMGNRTFVLPRGIVCDRCNNYFSRKVEQPFLDSPAVKQLRFTQSVPNKRGLVPPVTAVVDPGHAVSIYKHLDGPFGGVIDVGNSREALSALLKNQSRLYIPAEPPPPSPRQISRFLAKAAVEALAHRLLRADLSLDDLIDDPQFDPIRCHARLGETRDWPHLARRIYDSDRLRIPTNMGSQSDFTWAPCPTHLGTGSERSDEWMVRLMVRRSWS